MLNDSSNEESKSATRNTVKQQKVNTSKTYVKYSQTTKCKYKENNTIKFETETIKSSRCNYFDAFILVAGIITVTANNNTDIAFKNCAPFCTYTTFLMKQIIFTLQCLCTI